MTGSRALVGLDEVAVTPGTPLVESPGSGRRAQKNTKKNHNAENTMVAWTRNKSDHTKGEGRSPESS